MYLTDGNETPHFLSIFRGRMTIFMDEHEDEIPPRFLLHVTGNRQHNTCAKQVRMILFIRITYTLYQEH